MAAPERHRPVFFYDLSDPWCYLAAERVMAALPVVPEWEPVLAEELTARPSPLGPAERQAIAAWVDELALLPLRWPPTWPPDGRLAALAATYAKRGGRAVAFSLAAFRQAFAGGRDLSEEATVLIAAAACEMHPAAVLKGVTLRSTTTALQEALARAREAGVHALPALSVGGQVYAGEQAVEEAAASLHAVWR